MAYQMVRQEGIEPPTHSLEGCCSIQLSYWRIGTGCTLLLATTRGRGGRIRTGDLLLPKQARYRATLRPAKELGIVAGLRAMSTSDRNFSQQRAYRAPAMTHVLLRCDRTLTKGRTQVV